MTQKEFIKKLDEKGYSYEIEGDKLVVTHELAVSLVSLTSLPPGVEFKNKVYVDLDSLTSLPPGVVFSNEGHVWLNDLKSLPSGVEFRNGGDVHLNSIIGGWFGDWKGNIEGIDSKMLLNKMISKGIFER
jgi:hypothetical protein